MIIKFKRRINGCVFIYKTGYTINISHFTEVVAQLPLAMMHQDQKHYSHDYSISKDEISLPVATSHSSLYPKPSTSYFCSPSSSCSPGLKASIPLLTCDWFQLFLRTFQSNSNSLYDRL